MKPVGTRDRPSLRSRTRWHIRGKPGAAVMTLLVVGSALLMASDSEEPRRAADRRVPTTTLGDGAEGAGLAAPADAASSPEDQKVAARRAGVQASVATPRSTALGARPIEPGSSGVDEPDGPAGLIAFSMTDEHGSPSIYTVLPDGTALRELTPGHTPRWSPDGSQLAFLDETPVQNLFVIGADGAGRRQLTRDSMAFDPQWSPAGHEIAFVAARPTGTPSTTYSVVLIMPGWESDIEVVSTTTAAMWPLTVGPDSDLEPSWSPDGLRISFQRAHAAQTQEAWALYVANRDGTDHRRLWEPPSSGYLTGASWATGARIAVTAGANGRGDGLWLVAGDGSTADEIDLGATEWHDPVWSPGGDAVLVRSRNGDGIAAVTAGGQMLFHRPGVSATWSPDGTQVAFCSDGGLWRMDRDGSDAVRLVEGLRCGGGGLAWSTPRGA